MKRVYPIGLLLTAATLLLPVALEAQQAPPRCSTAEYRHFDFWVGEWEVHNSAGNFVGQNSIRRVHGTCALEENWMGASGSTGSSFNIYDRTRGVWHQTWVDNGGTLLTLEGALDESGSMILEGTTLGAGGSETLNRVTWSPLEDGRVRQHWETSSDGGSSWSTAFDGYYQRRAGG